MSDICVVHLVWRALGIMSLRQFAGSYRQRPGGIAHRLIVAFNGFADEEEIGEWREVLSGIEHEWFLVSPPTHDIPAYFEAARRLECEHLCFLNSHSRLLDSEWLAKMYEHAEREDAGVVGATGSWQSGYSYLLFQQGKRSAYTQLLKEYYQPWPAANRSLFDLSGELPGHMGSEIFGTRLISWLYRVARAGRRAVREQARHSKDMRDLLRKFAAEFNPFPAPHIRTNAFMMRRGVMLGLRLAPIRLKHDAHRFESGKEGLTAQVQRAGLRALVVGRDGRAYEPEQWHLSETLWQGQQRNLLVADNQTDDYADGDARRRVFLSRVAWGDRAMPSVDSLPPVGAEVGPSRTLSEDPSDPGPAPSH